MKNKALFDAKKIIAQIITDVVNLEGINYTVPEVQTLLDGITVGGHKLQDELITLNQIKAWDFLFLQLEQEHFAVNKEFLCQLHNLVACNEDLQWGCFRAGSVSISGTGYLPPQHMELNSLWQELAEDTALKLVYQDKVSIYAAAINLFAKMARIQFFYDGNKRTARMMMSGVLLMHRLPMINVGAKRQLEFNQTMLEYYETENLTSIYKFLISCLTPHVIEEYNLQDLTKGI